MQELKILEELRAIPTLTGFENRGKKEIARVLSPYFDDCREAGVAGLLFTKNCGEKDAKKILIDVHMDEIGWIVTDIEENGMLTVSPLGGMDPRTFTASRYTVHGTKDLTAVSLKKPFRLQSGAEAKKLPQAKDIVLFTGLKKEELRSFGVKVGTPVSMERRTGRMGDGQIFGAYMDDKSCAAAALAALEELRGKELSYDVCLLLSSQEESFGAGFATGVFDGAPDEILVVDVDLGFTPETEASKTVKMGEGPSVALSVQTDRRMTKELLRVAKERQIPVQAAMNVKSTGTNASGAPFLMGGIPTAVIGLPLKYMHTPVEMFYEEDLRNTGKLIAAYIEEHCGRKGESQR